VNLAAAHFMFSEYGLSWICACALIKKNCAVLTKSMCDKSRTVLSETLVAGSLETGNHFFRAHLDQEHLFLFAHTKN
jgi:hypothetical protein